MQTKTNLLALLLTLFVAVLFIGSPIVAHAEECGGGGGGNASGTGIGGYDGSNGDFYNNYQGAVQENVQERGQSIWQMFQDADTIDAKVDYCWDTLRAIFTGIAVTAMPWNAILIFILDAILAALINFACTFVIAVVKGALQTLISIFNSLLCLPIPRMNLPGFHVPWKRGVCQGTQLGQWLKLNASTPANNKNVIWQLWNKPQQQ